MGVIMIRWKALLLLAAMAALSGCVSLYQYQAEGEVITADGEERKAVVFWHKDEGRLWYLKKYEQLETDITLRICGETPKPFVLRDSDYVELLSKPNDMRVASVNANGDLVTQPPEQLRQGESCGLIMVGDLRVGTDGLTQNLRPEIVILCENQTRPDRYPAVAEYRFGAVSRTKIDKDTRPAPDPCR